MLQSLDMRLQEAAGNGLTHGEFLELILQDELLVRKDHQMQRHLKAAQFRELKTLEDFDWQFSPSIKKKLVYDLATGRFIREARDCLWKSARKRDPRRGVESASKMDPPQ